MSTRIVYNEVPFLDLCMTTFSLYFSSFFSCIKRGRRKSEEEGKRKRKYTLNELCSLLSEQFSIELGLYSMISFNYISPPKGLSANKVILRIETSM